MENYNQDNHENYLRFLLQKIQRENIQQVCLTDHIQQLNIQIVQIENSKIRKNQLLQELGELKQAKQELMAYIQQIRDNINLILSKKQQLSEKVLERDTIKMIEKFLNELEDKYESKNEQTPINLVQLEELFENCSNLLKSINMNGMQSGENTEFFEQLNSSTDLFESISEKNDTIQIRRESRRKEFENILERQENDLIHRFKNKSNNLDRHYQNIMGQLKERMNKLEQEKIQFEEQAEFRGEIDEKLLKIKNQRILYAKRIEEIQEEENQLLLEI